jgi:hypothetical protein
VTVRAAFYETVKVGPIEKKTERPLDAVGSARGLFQLYGDEPTSFTQNGLGRFWVTFTSFRLHPSAQNGIRIKILQLVTDFSLGPKSVNSPLSKCMIFAADHQSRATWHGAGETMKSKNLWARKAVPRSGVVKLNSMQKSIN